MTPWQRAILSTRHRVSGYAFSNTITVNSGQVTGTLTNYPMLISGTYSQLKTVANGGHVQSSSGYDIIPSSTTASDGSGAMAFELAKYDPTTGLIEMYVLVPSAAVGSVVYLLYGNAAATVNNSNPFLISGGGTNTGPFIIGETIKQSISNVTATVLSYTTNTITVQGLSGVPHLPGAGYNWVGQTSGSATGVSSPTCISIVWTAYKGVWHFGTSSSLVLTDSTGLGSSTNHSAAAAAGEVGGGAAFVNASPASGGDWIDTGATRNPSSAGIVSLEAWVNLATVPPGGGQQLYFPISNDESSDQHGYLLWCSNGAGGLWYPALLVGGTGGAGISQGNTGLSAGSYYHIVGTCDGTLTSTGHILVYVNGASQAVTSESNGSGPTSSGSNVALGSFTGGTRGGVNGSMDEVRIYNGVLSAAWIAADYNNQVAPSSFYAIT